MCSLTCVCGLQTLVSSLEMMKRKHPGPLIILGCSLRARDYLEQVDGACGDEEWQQEI